MKTILLLYLIILPFIGVSQERITFIDTTAKWFVSESYPHANISNPNFIETRTHVYGFKGDSIINNERWFKFFSTQDSSFMSNLIFLGLLKENNNYVMFKKGSNFDTIYNFSLNKGDSILYNFYPESKYIHVVKIDSIFLNGTYHKRFYFDNPIFSPLILNEIWIEGIGSIHGPLFPVNPRFFASDMPDSLDLTCFLKDNQTIWHNPHYKNCYLRVILSLQTFKSETINVFPNPVNNKLNIQVTGHNNKTYKISIFDISGKLLIQKNFCNKEIININTSVLLKNNLYILKIESRNEIYRYKFIK